MRFEHINKKLIDLNDGQIDGVFKNPRQFGYRELELLRKSIQETPELLEMRGVIVYPAGERYVAVGGNMRFLAMNMRNDENEIPCIVLPEDMSADKLKEIVIKDNSMFGNWSKDFKVEEWTAGDIKDWGVNVFDKEEDVVQGNDTPSISSDAKDFSVNFTSEEFYFVKEKLDEIAETKEKALLKIIGYE